MSHQSPAIRAFFDEATNTVSYLVFDTEAKRAAIIDPVLDYDHRTGKASTKSADAMLAAAREEGGTIDWVLETHAHADHLSGAPYVKLKTGAKVGIGEHIRDVQKIFRPVFNAMDIKGDGSEFDHLFMCHDYKAPGREHFAWESTVAEQRANNVHVRDGIGEDEYVAMREARDPKLAAPLLLMPSIQVNIRAGHLPPAEADGVHYLKIPVQLT